MNTPFNGERLKKARIYRGLTVAELAERIGCQRQTLSIVWGQNARRASLWDVGTRVHLLGRIQSREYIKNLDGQAVRRTAYEISVSDIAALPAE